MRTIEGAVGLAGGAFCYDWLDEKDVDVRPVPGPPSRAKPAIAMSYIYNTRRESAAQAKKCNEKSDFGTLRDWVVASTRVPDGYIIARGGEQGRGDALKCGRKVPSDDRDDADKVNARAGW